MLAGQDATESDETMADLIDHYGPEWLIGEPGAVEVDDEE